MFLRVLSVHAYALITDDILHTNYLKQGSTLIYSCCSLVFKAHAQNWILNFGRLHCLDSNVTILHITILHITIRHIMIRHITIRHIMIRHIMIRHSWNSLKHLLKPNQLWCGVICNLLACNKLSYLIILIVNINIIKI